MTAAVPCRRPVIEVRAVALGDWFDFAAQKLPLPAAEYRATSREVASGRVAGVFVDGVPILIGAVSSVGAGPSGFAWVSVADGGIASCSVSVVRACRRYLAGLGPVRGRVVAFVDDGNRQGQRLAHLVGFVPRDAVQLGLRIWEFFDGRDGTDGTDGGGHGRFGDHAGAERVENAPADA